jgi:glucokinase
MPRPSGDGIPRVTVGPAPSDDRPVAAVDVGGTSMKAAIVGSGYRLLADHRAPTPRDEGPDAVVQAIAACLASVVRGSGARPVAAGVVVPGIVDEANGVAVISVNLGGRDLSLAALLEERAGMPVTLGHDVRAGALAEHLLGAGRGVADLLFLPIGYGIAGAIIADGRPIVAGGHAGEIGHLIVEPGGDECGCGGRGCLEAVASGSAVARRYTARTRRPVSGAAEVAGLVRAGEPDARHVWDAAVRALATAIAVAANVTAPEVVVVGGGMSLSGDLLLAPLRAAVAERLTFQRAPRIVAAELGDRAGSLGAAIMAARSITGS